MTNPASSKSPPERWKEAAKGHYDQWIDAGLVLSDDTLSRSSGLEGYRDDWTPKAYRMRGNFIVQIEFQSAAEDPSPAQAYKRVAQSLQDMSYFFLIAGPFTFVMATERSRRELFDLLSKALDPTVHGFTVIDLMAQEGLTWNPVDGITFAFGSRDGWNFAPPANTVNDP